MPICQAKIRNRNTNEIEPCPKTVEEGKTFCRWHDPEDQSWREIYDYLVKAMPKERMNKVLELIEDHPEHILKLPRRDDVQPHLPSIDLSRETLNNKKKEHCGVERPAWWSSKTNGANLEYADLQGAYLEYARLQSAFLREADLQDANLRGAKLQNAVLRGADLQGAVLLGASLQEADLRRAKLQGVDLSRVEDMTNVFISDALLDRTRIRRELFGSAIGEEIKCFYSAAKRGYLALKQNFDDLGDYDSASWAYRKERRMEKLEARQKGKDALTGKVTDEQGHASTLPLSKRKWGAIATSYFEFASDTFVEWLCDYGESVWRVIGWMAILIFIVGPFLLSAIGGFTWRKDLLDSYLTLTSPLQRFLYRYHLYLQYSLGAFSTANFSGLEPANDAVKYATNFFTLSGIFLAGLLGFVAGNRIRRS